MDFDTECDLIIRAEQPETSAQIARIRNSLLAEHLGKREEDVAGPCVDLHVPEAGWSEALLN